MTRSSLAISEFGTSGLLFFYYDDAGAQFVVGEEFNSEMVYSWRSGVGKLLGRL